MIAMCVFLASSWSVTRELLILVRRLRRLVYVANSHSVSSSSQSPLFSLVRERQRASNSENRRDLVGKKRRKEAGTVNTQRRYSRHSARATHALHFPLDEYFYHSSRWDGPAAVNGEVTATTAATAGDARDRVRTDRRAATGKDVAAPGARAARLQRSSATTAAASASAWPHRQDAAPAALSRGTR